MSFSLLIFCAAPWSDCERTVEEFVEQQRQGLTTLRDVNQFKVYDKAAWETGRQGWCFCDLFLYDRVGDHVRVREDHCYLIPMPVELVLPLRACEFLGQQCWEPADAENWLEFQYGEDWSTRSKTMGWLSTRADHRDAWLWFQHE